MSKRFTDTEKWINPWFRNLPNGYRWFWLYVLDNCNAAGIWRMDFETASFHLGTKINERDALAHFGQKVVQIEHDKWFIPAFLKFQYKDLSPNSPPHKKVIELLQAVGITTESISSYYPKATLPTTLGGRVGTTLQDKEEDKDKDKEEEEDAQKFDLDAVYRKYPRKQGRSRGLAKLKTQLRSLKDFEDFSKAVDSYIQNCKDNATEKKYIKHFDTFVSEWKDWLDPETGKSDGFKEEIDWTYITTGKKKGEV